MSETTTTTTTTTDVTFYSAPFLPLPEWSRFDKMPPLPDQLKPLGRKSVVAIATTPVILRKDPGESTPPVFIPKPKNVPVVTDDPLVSVSPFLRWIKDHPKDAALEARKQAAMAAAPTGPMGGAPGALGAPPAGADPYWMPPLIDSGDNSSQSTSDSTSTSSGGSAAIYSRPQKN